MAEVSRDYALELGYQVPYAIGLEIEREQFDRKDAIPLRIVRRVDRPECPGPDLVQHTKWTQRIGGRGAGGVRVQ
jgi:hypothetical protein